MCAIPTFAGYAAHGDLLFCRADLYAHRDFHLNSVMPLLYCRSRSLQSRITDWRSGQICCLQGLCMHLASHACENPGKVNSRRVPFLGMPELQITFLTAPSWCAWQQRVTNLLS